MSKLRESVALTSLSTGIAAEPLGCIPLLAGIVESQVLTLIGDLDNCVSLSPVPTYFSFVDVKGSASPGPGSGRAQSALPPYLVYFPLPGLTHTTLNGKSLEIRGVIKMSILQVWCLT